jgi:L-asparaginase / beta-aspartyl-peptidase
MSDVPFVVALHGGAGASRSLDYTLELADMRRLLTKAAAALSSGATALDVVCDTVVELEDSGLYIAGRGSSPNTRGEYELDAAIIDGPTRRTGAVASMRFYRNPVLVARALMERTPFALLAGTGAESFAGDIGAERHAEAEWFTHAGRDESNFPPEMPSGTVGCVALDQRGRLASATSTGGVFGKMPGRVGDTPLLGAGFWADEHCAVSCTGQGELFIRSACAARVGLSVEAGVPLAAAAEAAIESVASLGGEGGLIAIDSQGNVAMPFNAEGLKRGFAKADGTIYCAVFD